MDHDTRSRMIYEASRKDVVVAYLLWFFLSLLGVHRFYLGRTASALAQLGLFLVGIPLLIFGIGFLMWLALGVWILVDAVLIPGMVREHNLGLIRSM